VNCNVDEAKRQNDTTLLEVLAVLREELDEVKEKLMDVHTDMNNAERAEVEDDEDEKKLIDSLNGMTAAERDEGKQTDTEVVVDVR
jgi:hypothetical protein